MSVVLPWEGGKRVTQNWAFWVLCYYCLLQNLLMKIIPCTKFLQYCKQDSTPSPAPFKKLIFLNLHYFYQTMGVLWLVTTAPYESFPKFLINSPAFFTLSTSHLPPFLQPTIHTPTFTIPLHTPLVSPLSLCFLSPCVQARSSVVLTCEEGHQPPINLHLSSSYPPRPACSLSHSFLPQVTLRVFKVWTVQASFCSWPIAVSL